MIEVRTFLEETLGRLPENHPDRQEISRMLKEAQMRVNISSFPEQLSKPLVWSDKEQEVLKNDGAAIYLLTSETIRGQKESGRPFWGVNSGFEINGGNRLLDVHSKLMHVAIYPDPERFFVPGSFNKAKVKQEELVLDDRDKLKKRLGIENLDEILPEAVEGTEVVFKHFDLTGERLLGKNFGFRWMRTNTPTNVAGSEFALVGSFNGVYGLSVDDWFLDGNDNLGAARWLVPTGNRK